MKRVFILVLVLFLVGTHGFSQAKFAFQDANLSIDQRVKDLLSQMTLEEKFSQLLYTSAAIPRLGVPEYNWWNEALHGVARSGRATVFPQAIGMAATFDTALIQRVASAISDEARAKFNEAVKIGNRGQYAGLSFWSPNINIFRDPRWGRGQETYGEDPFLTAQIGIAFVRGLQGNNPKYMKTSACAKHFAVHSGPEPIRHTFNAKANPRDLRETYLPAFKALTDAGVESVMCAYNRTNDEPCCSSNTLLRNILRNEWKYQGHIVSDCWALEDIWLRHKYIATEAEAAAISLKAGVNVECGTTYKALPEAYKKGLITIKDVDDQLSVLLKTRFKLGLLDPQELNPWKDLGIDVINCEKHRLLAREVAAKSVVLLKNKNNVLPFKNDMKSLFVTGPLAADVNVLLGNYNGMSGNLNTILEGIVKKVSNGTTVQYLKGTELTLPVTSGTWTAAQCQATIAVVGFSPLMEGEEGDAMLSDNNGDRKEIKLPANQVVYIKELRKAIGDRPLVVVVMGGSAVSFPEIEEYADAILFGWYPGEEGGNAIADVIFGDVVPSGRLPLTFYKSVSDLPAFENYDMKGRTYRYFEPKALFPFGFGLSYTQFEYTGLALDKPKYKIGEKVNLNFKLANTGKFEGEEVVQMYVRVVDRLENDPLKSLKAFKRVNLKIGENKDLSFTIKPEDLQFWNVAKNTWEIRPCKYEVLIGASSEDIRLKQIFEIKK